MCAWWLKVLVTGSQLVLAEEVRLKTHGVLGPRTCDVYYEAYVAYPFLISRAISKIDEYDVALSGIYTDNCDDGGGLKLVFYEHDGQLPEVEEVCDRGQKWLLDLPCTTELDYKARLKLPLVSTSVHGMLLCNCSTSLDKSIVTNNQMVYRGSWGSIALHEYPLVIITEVFAYVMFSLLLIYVILCMQRRHRVYEPQKCVIGFLCLSFIYSLMLHHCYYQRNLPNTTYMLALMIFRDVLGATYRLAMMSLQLLLSVGWGLVYLSLLRKLTWVIGFSIVYMILTIMRDCTEYFIGHTFNLMIPLMQVPMMACMLASFVVSNMCVQNLIRQLEFHGDAPGTLLFRRQYLLNTISTSILLIESILRIVYFFMPPSDRLPYYWLVGSGFLLTTVVFYILCLIVLWRPRDVENISKVSRVVEHVRQSLFGTKETELVFDEGKFISASVARVVSEEETVDELPEVVHMSELNV